MKVRAADILKIVEWRNFAECVHSDQRSCVAQDFFDDFNFLLRRSSQYAVAAGRLEHQNQFGLLTE